MGSASEPLGIGLAGCGTVGGAVARMLTADRSALLRLGRPVELRRIFDTDYSNARRLELDEGLFADSLEQLLNDDGVEVVVELIGGITAARDVIERAIRAAKGVVTANKALLAHHGPQLFALARENGVCIGFEASCAGGVPIIQAICDGLIANRIDALYGIVNGTCNYILTAMTQHGVSYADALVQAQADGLAEADPTLDVCGLDSAHKLTILASLAFGRRVDLDAVVTEGIDKLELCDINYGAELGYVVKLLGIARQHAEGLSLRVRPAFIAKDHPLAWVCGPFNAVSVYGHATGHTLYYGRGAGAMPTASAVLADIASMAIGTAQRRFSRVDIWPDQAPEAELLKPEAVRSRFYIRVTCDDKPGVLAQIAAILGRNGISILSVLQHEPAAGKDAAAGVPVVITTHQACEGGVRKAIDEVDSLDAIRSKTVCMAIVDEYPEQI